MKRFFVLLALMMVACTGGGNVPGLSPLAVEFDGGSTQDAIDFGFLPALADPAQRSISAWIYMTDDGTTANTIKFIAGLWSDDAAFGVFTSFNAVGTSRRLKLQLKYTPSGRGEWGSPVESLPFGQLTHVVVTKELDTSDAPVMYIDGVSQIVTETTTPPSPPNHYPEASVHFTTGNIKTATLDYSRAFPGKIFDVRVYDRIITAAEVTAIYNSGTPSMSAGTKTGLVFHSFAVRNEKLADYTDADLSGLKLFDAQYLAVGEVVGSVTGRAAP